MSNKINNDNYCLVCQKNVNPVIKETLLKYHDDQMDIEYIGQIALCKECGEELYNDDVNQYNQDMIIETYKIEYEIITKEEIEEIISKYKIGKRPLSLLLGFGEITITRYLDGYVPTTKNSKILKTILNSPSDYYSILELNKNKITEAAYKKSEDACKKLLNINSDDDVIIDVSKYIINTIETTNLSLQKLLYYVQLFHLAIFKKPAFTSRCGAWQHGPVFGRIYYKYKSNNRNIIFDELPTNNLNKDLKELVDQIIHSFGCYTGLVLKTFTHLEKPWLDAVKTSDKIIYKSNLQQFGESILKEYNINKISDINKYSESMFKKYQLFR